MEYGKKVLSIAAPASNAFVRTMASAFFEKKVSPEAHRKNHVLVFLLYSIE